MDNRVSRREQGSPESNCPELPSDPEEPDDPQEDAVEF